MSDLNMCTVSMRITKDVKIKEQEKGVTISFSGAIHEDVKKEGSWSTNTTFMDVFFYVKDKERFSFKKGDWVVLINAKLGSYRNKDNQQVPYFFVKENTGDVVLRPAFSKKENSGEKPEEGEEFYPTL